MDFFELYLTLYNFSNYFLFILAVIFAFIGFIILSINYLSISETSINIETNIKKKEKKVFRKENLPPNNPEHKKDGLLNQSLKNTKEKTFPSLSGYLKVLFKENENKYIFSEFSENIGKFSEETYDYYRLRKNSPSMKNKNGELSWMLLESLSSLNSSKTNEIESVLFQNSNWYLEKEENNGIEDEHVTSHYIYPKSEKLEVKNSKNINNSEYELIEEENYKLGIVRTFESNNFIKTNIVKEIKEKFYKVYCEGDPLKIKAICNLKTIPDNFDQIIDTYTSEGNEILALCGKQLKMTYLQSQKIDRKHCESNLVFLGFIIYKYDRYKAYS